MSARHESRPKKGHASHRARCSAAAASSPCDPKMGMGRAAARRSFFEGRRAKRRTRARAPNAGMRAARRLGLFLQRPLQSRRACRVVWCASGCAAWVVEQLTTLCLVVVLRGGGCVYMGCSMGTQGYRKGYRKRRREMCVENATRSLFLGMGPGGGYKGGGEEEKKGALFSRHAAPGGVVVAGGGILV